MTTTTPRTAQAREALRITGLVPPLPTPFLDGRVDLESIARQLEELHEHVDGVLIGGSTGEAASLTIEERESVIRAVAGLLGRDRQLVVSIADNSIENCRRLSEIAGECGAHLLVLSCPTYFPNDRAMLEAYFAAVAEFASADICLYDNPIASNTWLSCDDIVSLIAAAPRLTHVKMTDTALGKVRELRASTTATILAGDDSVLWHHLVCGAEGIMTAVPLIYPARAARMWRLFASGDVDGAYAAYRELSHFILTGINADYPAAVKAVLHHRKVFSSADVRLPLLPLSSERQVEILMNY